jgi:hypothetical protein
MPKQKMVERARRAKRQGKSATTQVNLPPPRKGRTKKTTRKSATYVYEVGQHKRTPKRRPRVARAVSWVMKKEPRDTVSRAALSRHAKKVASKKVASRKTSKRAAATMKSAVKRLARPSAASRKAPSAASRKAGRARKRRTT